MAVVAELMVGGTLAGCGGGGQAEREPEPGGETSATQATDSDLMRDPSAPEVEAVAPAAQRPAPPSDTSATGVVQIVGADPFSRAVLRTGEGADATTVGLEGDLIPELHGLSGATVRVWGTPTAGSPPQPARAIRVSRYEIVAVQGERPHVGQLQSGDGRLLLTGEDTLIVVGASPRLRRLDGAKVWIVGDRSGDTLRLRSYGVIQQRSGS